ncbi:MAG: hypothetical protein A2W08_07110 [Candidatus Rokubacteria bacterium RBG_16_73_20]|nr:MAG: hypothetical protein A2W08_07110 [Candidatus Rokubacteria bacterium RBG_16_73_20]HBH03977.1 hypothetical protein [Candidatus Rokubacteria bacterium]
MKGEPSGGGERSDERAARRAMRRPEDGFTLLEVLVAFTILSLAVVATIQGFAQGLRLLRVAGDHQQAVLLADQRLREVVTPVAGGHDEGTDGAFAWERTTTVVDAPDLARSRATEPWRVYRITVRVRWGEGQPRQVELAALRASAERPEPTGARP